MSAAYATYPAMNETTPPAARFWDRIAAKYAAQPVADEAAYRYKLETTRAYLTPESDVLEFACGTGSTALAHAPHVRSILATDISANMIDIALGKAREAGVDNVTFRRTALDDLTTEACYDMVMGHSILHLLPDPPAAIAKVRAMLKPGGVFVSSTACIGETMGWLKPVLALMRLVGKAPYVNVFRVRDLVRNLEEGGFAIEHQWQPGKGKAVFIVARKVA